MRGGVRTLSDNVLAAHVHSGTSQLLSIFTHFIFSAYFMDVGHVGASLSFLLPDR